MADFLDALGQYATNRFNQAIEPFNDPQQAINNRFNQAIEPFNDPQQAINNRLGINTATNAAPVAAPVNPQMGPTIAASQGLQPNNPLNMARPVGPTAPANTAQDNAILPSNQISPSTVAAPTAPAANQQPDQLNAPHLTSGNGPTQIPTGQGAIPPAVQNPVQAPQPAPGARVTNAIQPGANYYQSIANQESGGNPNIGYHNNGSTAYGTYGITAPAYQDVQRADPYFASKSITALTPEDQQRAAQVYTTLNGRQLQKNGIDPTDENLRLAHFLGATGAKNYLNNGTISPAAARANGGEDRVRQIIGNIQQGTAQNVSAPGAQPQANAAPVEQAQPFANEYRQINEGDPINLLTLAKSDNPAIASAAKAKLYDTFKDQKMQSDAKQIVDAKLANGQNPWPQGKSTEEGSYIKAYLFARLGLNDLATQEQEKISPTRSTMPVMLGNQHYAATYSKNGELLYAYDEAGQRVDSATFNKLAANAYGSKGLETGQTMMKDTQGNMWSHSTQKGTNQIIWTNQSTGQTQTTAPTGLTPFGQVNPVTRASISLATSAERMMLNRNDKDKAAGLTPTYSQDAIDAEKARILNGGQPQAAMTETPTATGATTPTAAAPTMAAPTAGKGEVERRGTPALESQAQAIFNGEQAMPTGMGANNARNQWISARVQEIAQQTGKPFDPTVFKNRQEVETAFTKGKQSDVVRSMNVAIDHLDTLQQASKALNNGQIPMFNDIANKFAKNTGQPAPTDFDAVKTLVGSEVAKAVAGGATALGDREEIRAEINNARSPAQLAGVIDKYQRLLAGQMNGLETQYKSGGGQRWDDKINPETKAVMDKIKKEREPKPVVPAPYSDGGKEARYQEWLKKHPEYQGTK